MMPTKNLGRPNHKPGAWAAFTIVSLFFLFEFIGRIEPSLALSDIAAWYGLSNTGFGSLSSIFFWVYAPMQLCVGLLLDRYGIRRFVVPAILIFSIGIALFAISSNPLIAVAGRFMTGLGASFGFVSGLYVVGHWFPSSRFAVLSGSVNALGMLGTAIGAVALTAAIEDVGWRPIFFGTSIAGFVLFITAFLFLHDLKGIKNSRQSLLEPLKVVLVDGRTWWLAMLSALYYVPVNVFGSLWGKAELKAEHGLSPIKAETAVSMIFWGMAVGSIGTGWLSDKIGHRKWFVVSNAALATVAYTTAIYGNSTSIVYISILLFLGGMFGGAQMLTFAMAKEGLPKTVSGTVIAFINMIGIGGALVFQPLVGAISDSDGGHFSTALLVIPICLIVTTVMSLFVSEKRHTDHRDDALPLSRSKLR